MDHPSSLILPLSKWQHRPNKHTSDAAPAPLITEVSTNDSDENYDVITAEIGGTSEKKKTNHKATRECAVCRQNESRYQCPKCQLPYCTVACYRIHNSSSSGSSSSLGPPCTEAFYKNRVSEILQLEVSEKQSLTRQLLHRHHHNESVFDESLQSNLLEISEIELYDLLVALEDQRYSAEGGSGDATTIKHLQSLLSPSIRAAFDSALQSGELSDLVLQRWSPWWKPELANNDDSYGGTDTGQDVKTVFEGSLFHGGGTLDERLLEIPPFTTFNKIRSPPPNLMYNLVDIVYGAAWNLRLYLGTANAVFSPVDSYETIIAASSVLGKDARYTTLEEVLSDCTARSMRQYPSSGCNAHWTTLTEDVAILTNSHRHVGRCLLETIDIVSASIRFLKKQRHSDRIGKQETSEEENANGMDEQIKQMKRMRKKLEFYVSWSQYQYRQQPTAYFGAESLQSDISAWIDHWKLSNPNDNNERLDHLVLPIKNK